MKVQFGAGRFKMLPGAGSFVDPKSRAGQQAAGIGRLFNRPERIFVEELKGKGGFALFADFFDAAEDLFSPRLEGSLEVFDTGFIWREQRELPVENGVVVQVGKRD